MGPNMTKPDTRIHQMPALALDEETSEELRVSLRVSRDTWRMGATGPMGMEFRKP